MVRKPRYGYGGHMNPCISCKIMMLKKAKEFAEKIGAKFIITGFVLGQRPMSQHMKALMIIEEESGCSRILLNPLSAKVLPETEPEKKGWVDRDKLMDIQGRGRKKQMELAKKFGVKEYPSPAGGCLLCDANFSRRLKDLFERKKELDEADIEILKFGRHFKSGENRIIVGRNKKENDALERLKKKTDYVFEVKDAGSPITILQGEKTKKAIKIAAELTARYSDAEDGKVNVSYGEKSIVVEKPLGYDEKEFRI
jgi:tRNA U34 2-thiouridine synthase MnmA/TrmU